MGIFHKNTFKSVMCLDMQTMLVITRILIIRILACKWWKVSQKAPAKISTTCIY